MGVRVFVPLVSATGVPLSPATKDYVGADFTFVKEDGRLLVQQGGATVEEFRSGEWVDVEVFQL